MAKQFYVKPVLSYNHNGLVGYAVIPNIPDEKDRPGLGWRRVGYASEGVMIVEFTDEVPQEVEQLIRDRGGVPTNEQMPTFPRELKPKDIADQDAVTEALRRQ